MECQICAYDFTKRKYSIKCQYCEFDACAECYTKLLLSQTSHNKPKCFSNECLGIWSGKFLRQQFTHSFLNTKLREHYKNILVDKQIALMPETQLIIEEQNRLKKLNKLLSQLNSRSREIVNEFRVREEKLFGESKVKKRVITDLQGWHGQHYGKLYIDTLSDSYRRLNVDTYTLGDCGLRQIFKNIFDNYGKIDDCVKLLDTKVTEYNKTIDAELASLNSEREAALVEINISIEKVKKRLNSNNVTKKAEFIKKCSDSECRGFLSTRWKCGLCEKTTCTDCHEIKTDGHTCNPDSVATIKLLSTDTKGCPKCQTLIYKIDGCDQMWCTSCKTGFSWSTGKIEMKLHNPHYYEWRRQNGGLDREPGDVPCGDDGNPVRYLYDIIQESKRHPSIEADYGTKIENLMRRITHLSAYNHVQIEPSYESYRIQYLKNEISKDEFKDILIRADKAHSKKTDTYTLIQLLVTTVTDIFIRIRADLTSSEPDQYDRTIISEIPRIIDYVNECFADLAYTYTCISKRVYDYELNEKKIIMKSPKIAD